MIFFVPTYDEQTRANFQVIQNALPTEGVHLIAQNALRANLLHHLTQNDVLFVMSHGKNDCFYDHSDSPALQVSDEFTRKSVFIFACLTANELGRSWQNRTGNIYWGYTGTINAPINEPQIASIFTPIFRQIINTFSEQRTREQVLQTLQNIKDLCDTAADELDAAAANLEAYNCVYHIWSRLRILMSEGNFLIKHQEAAEGDLF